MIVLGILLGGLVVLWLVARFVLAGPELSGFDEPRPATLGGRIEASPEHAAVVARILKLGEGARERVGRAERVRRMRDALEQAFGQTEVDAEIRPVSAAGVPAEWVLSRGADPARRMLYLHGGAFMAGSPKSHRPLTARLSAENGAAVLSVDYRLMPENRRLDCPMDCATAYRWILENGPEGKAPLDTLFVGGDSAGGNLALVVIAWARDEGLRPADAAVAFSPLTDSTYSAPSLRSNLGTDPMLAETFRQVQRLPRWLLLWGSFLLMRVRPQDPRVSPVFGSLAGLPPVLVQASTAEVLIDDGRRWVNKARAEGTDATLQCWPGVVHVFQAFVPDLPEANEALAEVRTFFEAHAPRAAGQDPGGS
jgi:monoterpene epsilon-lactone hydrolase